MDIIKEIKKLDKTKIIRPDYGQTSLKTWEPKFDHLLSKLDFIEKYSSKVDRETTSQVTQSLTNIHQQLAQMITKSDAQFVNDKQNFIAQIDNQLNVIIKYWPNYAIAAIEESGLLTNTNVKKEFDQLTLNLQQATNEALAKIEKESGEIINEARKKAEEIESSVRKTAQKISVKEAQEQFASAAKKNMESITIWGGITLLLVLVFISFIGYMLRVKLPESWTWQIIYYSIIRAAILGFIGTLLAFSLKILKSHLHMREHNLHRERIANSMSAFAESAMNKDQRDIILLKLVESVADFGNSGMIGKDDDNNSKVSIENITRTISALKPAGS
jgi:hypothetical protein